MRTMWIGGPYHAAEVERAISGTGKHVVSGAHGPHGYVQFLVLGSVLFCRHESLTDGEATRLLATVKR